MSKPSLPISLLPADTPVLLVLLAALGVAPFIPVISAVALTRLQQQLGAAVRVLRIDAASHPTVVSSFHATELPCFVLVHRGVELWRACGLPDAATIVPQLLSKQVLIP